MFDKFFYDSNRCGYSLDVSKNKELDKIKGEKLMEELKPCPFCGSKDIQFVYIEYEKGWCAIQCQKCFAEFRGNFMY